MSKLLERLQDPAKSGVYRATRVDAIADAVRGTKLNFARIALEDATAKPALLRSIGAALGFPGWFGENWDALEDCLTDLSWRPAQGHVVIFESIGSLSTDDLGVLIDVLSSAAQFWATQGTPFFAVFVDPAQQMKIPDLFRGA